MSEDKNMKQEDKKSEEIQEDKKFAEIQEEPVEKAKLNLIQRVIKIFVAPSEGFEDIERKPKILVPLLVLMGISAAVFALQYNVVYDSTLKSLVDMYAAQGITVSYEDIETIAKASSMAGFAGASLVLAVFILGKGLVTHAICGLTGGEGTLKTTVSVIVYSYFIVILGSILSGILIALTGDMTISFSPAMFLSSDSIASPLYTAMSYLNIFTLWYLAVSIIGIKRVQKLSTMRSAIAVVLPYLLMMAASVGAVMMFSQNLPS